MLEFVFWNFLGFPIGKWLYPVCRWYNEPMADLVSAQDGLLHRIDPNQGKPAVEPPGFYQAVILDALSLFSAIGFGYTYRNFLTGTMSGWWVISLLAAFGVCSGLQALLINKTSRRLLVIAGEVIVMGAFFYGSDPAFFVAALLLMFGFLALGYWEMRQELHHATTIRFFTVTKGMLGKFMTGILLLMILLYLPQQSSPALFISENSFDSFFTWSANFVQLWYPNLPLIGSFGDLSQKLIESELKNNPTFKSLSLENQSTTVATNASQLLTSFSNNLGFTVHASDTVASVVYSFIMETLGGWQNRFAGAFVVGWSVLIFLVLRSIGIVFVWLIQILLAICYEILLALGVIKVREHPATQEVVEF